MSLVETIYKRVTQQGWIFPLVTFRVVFGLAGLIGVIRIWLLGWIDDKYIKPSFHFHYQYFEWVEPLPAWGIYAVFGIQAMAAIGIVFGACFRISTILYFFSFTYIELLDKAYYLNHYYFVSLASLLLVFSQANRFLSIDVWRKPELASLKLPAYETLCFKVLIGILYTYAGLAKINSDWLLKALPLSIWLPPHYDMPLLGIAMQCEITPYVFSWAGMIFDTTIVVWLMWGKTRPFAYLILVLFHVVTGYLFPIGMFPTIMSFIVLIFFSPLWHWHWQKRIIKSLKWKPINRKAEVTPNRLKLAFVSGFLVFQLLLPWRFLLYPGALFWTEDGYRFSWRVMLMEKAGHIDFYVHSYLGRQHIFLSEWLNEQQIKQMSFQPDMILEFAHHLANHFEHDGKKPVITAECFVTLNGAPGKLYFNPESNLAEIPLWTPGYRWLNK